MATTTKRRTWSRPGRARVALDERGGSADGGLAILDKDGSLIHMTHPRVAASLRFFVARVQLSDDEGLPPRLAITSALRGEGVSYVTRSLAAVVAYDSEHSIAVVDLNWLTPPPANSDARAKTDVAAAAAGPGLADAVEGTVTVEEIILPTSNPRLSLVSAGAVTLAQRPALASSRALEEVINQIAERFDHVLLDLPPVLASSEAIKLSQLADAYLLVIAQGATLRSQVEAALEELPEEHALGVVLNRYGTHIPKALRRVVGA